MRDTLMEHLKRSKQNNMLNDLTNYISNLKTKFRIYREVYECDSDSLLISYDYGKIPENQAGLLEKVLFGNTSFGFKIIDVDCFVDGELNFTVPADQDNHYLVIEDLIKLDDLISSITQKNSVNNPKKAA